MSHLHPEHDDPPTVRKSRIQRRRTSEFLASELRSMILFGELDGQGRLPSEPEFAEQLGVSRHHLREALRLLEQDGLVKVRPGRNGGIFLTIPTVDVLMRAFTGILARTQTSLADLMAARLVVEPAAAALAARHATEAELDSLDELLRAQEAGEGDQATANARFHVALTAAGHNRTLLLMMQSMQGLIRTVDIRLGTVELSLHSGRAHRRIMRSVRARDAAGTEELVRLHLQGFEDTLRAQGVDFERLTIADVLHAAELSNQPRRPEPA